MRRVREVVLALAFIRPLLFLSVVSSGFFVVGALENHSLEFWYLIWNLFLAWLPLIFALALIWVIKIKGWTSWEGIVLSILWLAFLPNSFYMVSDLIHLQDYQRANLVFDAVTFASFAITGLVLGFVSLYLVHVQLIKRLKWHAAWVWMSVVLLTSSFAIYLGRDLRMNSWNVLTNPAGILVDVSDPIANPTAHVLAFTTTLTFFVFLLSLYVAAWQLTHALKRSR